MVGATTNVINWWVSEAYFRQIMGWDFEGIWMAAVLQGTVEGLIYGLILSLLFTLGFGLITQMKADWRFAKRQLKKMVLTIYGCWILGGLIAILLAFAFPEGYDQMIIGVPSETLPRMGYAWVGGSIWGGIAGGGIAAIAGLGMTKRDWKTQL